MGAGQGEDASSRDSCPRGPAAPRDPAPAQPRPQAPLHAPTLLRGRAGRVMSGPGAPAPGAAGEAALRKHPCPALRDRLGRGAPRPQVLSHRSQAEPRLEASHWLQPLTPTDAPALPQPRFPCREKRVIAAQMDPEARPLLPLCSEAKPLSELSHAGPPGVLGGPHQARHLPSSSCLLPTATITETRAMGPTVGPLASPKGPLTPPANARVPDSPRGQHRF